MKQPSPAIVKKIQALAKLAADLRQGRHFNITRLTVIKSFCSDPEAAAKFAVYIAKLAQRQFKARLSGDTEPTIWQQYGQLIDAAILAMTHDLKSPTEETKSKLRELYKLATEAQNRIERRQWGYVRHIECGDLLMVETAMESLLNPQYAPLNAYQMARQYSERYDPHHGTGLIPTSAPMVEEIVAFWERHFLDRG